MKRIIVTGCLGQIGSELIARLRKDKGTENVLATDIKKPENHPVIKNGLFETLDVLDEVKMYDLAKNFKADTIIHLASLLSATAEDKPQFAWHLNMTGLMNALETARKLNLKFFTPSSIGAFGPETPKVNTPQDTIQRPKTMYGITKTAGELLCDYYYNKFGVDTRGVRFPGLISYDTLPGGGTTDYAVEIYYEAIKKGMYKSPIGKGTYMDMMYMPDAIDSIIKLLETPQEKLIHRNAFNVSAMSFDPEEIKNSIKKFIPSFSMTYEVNPKLQKIANSWPDSLDVSAAKKEWGFSPKYNLDEMSKDMIEKLNKKLA
ncbi:L-threonine 3-dehydrogenase [[Mycoplasma] mobile]|uniref:NAD-dependent nucleoside-diphosphate-sugar epimerase n=1 Tax=Mycoplasma mobile (strain ATCC 43663 / 163K / NCTC 11711) TaxID=267748 RepID=Q6KH65_MYCM1|nr:L-threonine 3-dehydrogenase [[Mycoplasma] mobile]AAT28065.1 NAD-dependent nucleoside-diphosphate-sugar epimerase [Mycoplasma mobile 163K]